MDNFSLHGFSLCKIKNILEIYFSTRISKDRRHLKTNLKVPPSEFGLQKVRVDNIRLSMHIIKLDNKLCS